MKRFFAGIFAVSVVFWSCGHTSQKGEQAEPTLPQAKNGESELVKEKKAKAPANAPRCFIAMLKKEGKSLQAIKNAAISEPLGKLSLGLLVPQVIALLGEPDAKSKPAVDAATENVLSRWKWKAKGVSLTMLHAESGKISVIEITVVAPFKGETSCGTGVGSLFEKAQKLYGPYLDKDNSTKDVLIVGSVYGGMRISMGNDHTIKEIAIGAFAE